MWLHSGVRPDLWVTATNIRKFIVTVLQENKTAGAEFDESGVRIAMCHTQKTAMNSYLREDLTAVASQAARTIRQFTDKSLNFLLNKPVNQAVVAVDKEASNSYKEATSTFNTQDLSKLGKDNVAYPQPDEVGGVHVEPNLPSSERRPLSDGDKDSRNSECEPPSTFIEHSCSKSVRECDMGVDEEDPNGTHSKEAHSISNRQLFSKPTNRHDVAVPVDKEPSHLEQDVASISNESRKRLVTDDDKGKRNSEREPLSSFSEHSRSKFVGEEEPNSNSSKQPLSKPANRDDA